MQSLGMHESSGTPYPSGKVFSLPDSNFLATCFPMEAYLAPPEEVK